jgi:hypothetical protein
MLKGLLGFIASHKRSCCNSNRCSCGVWAETCLIVLSVENGWLKNDQPFVGQLLPQTLRHTQIYLGRTRSCSGFAQSGHGFNRPEGRTNGFSAKKKTYFFPLTQDMLMIHHTSIAVALSATIGISSPWTFSAAIGSWGF